MGSYSLVLKKIKAVLGQPRLIILLLLHSPISRFFSDDFFLKIKFFAHLGYWLNLKHPNTFNAKIQKLKVVSNSESLSCLVDKFEAREYISNCVGSEYLVPLVGHWSSTDSIRWDDLPRSFVLKVTHDSGGVFCVKDKGLLTTKAKNDIITNISKRLSRNYYNYTRERPYMSVVPSIIAEEFLESGVGGDLLDFKLMVFNGKVRCSFICSERYSPGGLKVDFFDRDWNPMPFYRVYPNSGLAFSKPAFYEEMISIAERLSGGLDFLRVDFYVSKGKLYVGELTLFPGSGFEAFTPPTYDYLLGSWLRITK